MGRPPPVYCRANEFSPPELSYYLRQGTYHQSTHTYLNHLELFNFVSPKSKFSYKPIEATVRKCGLVLFVFIFISVLFSLFMAVFLHGVIMRDYPHLTGTNSLLQHRPGLSLVPQPDIFTTLIRFKMGKKYAYRKFVDDLVAFTQQYEYYNAPSDSSLEDCFVLKQNPQELNTRLSCRFDLNKGGPCNINYDFGYGDGVPCVILKMNRIYGWLPQSLPSDSTDDHSNNNGSSNTDDLNGSIRVRCRGASEVDDEYMGPLCYYDDDHLVHSRECFKTEYGEFKHWYFPFLKQSNYHSPLVFVQFRDIRRFVTIRVECSLEGANVDPEAVHFEIHMF